MYDINKIISAYGYEDVLVFHNPSYETAFIGVSLSNQAVYDYDKMVEYLMIKEKMSLEEATDFIYWNESYSSSRNGEYPIIVQRMDE